tara:strand:+ start:449 stop:1495 length:1047 start_codon:yes stop_codon:yes gene_type:complete
MTHKVDDTLRDDGRREISQITGREVNKVIPEHFKTDYPKLVSFLEQYYHFEDSDGSPSRLVNDLFYTRDINQVDESLLSYIEDELLLGQSYFEGFTDKRTAAKFSNNLYRAKGTKFSIEQFFRMFFEVDIDLEYTKEQVFKIGEAESEIGAESQKFITNAELFQQFALRITSELPFKKWQRPYKLFVHPAGMFIGSAVRLEGIVDNPLSAPISLVDSDVGQVDVVGVTAFNFDEVTQFLPEITGIARDSGDSDGIFKRVIIDDSFFTSLQNTSLEDIQKQYSTLRAAELRTSPTFDADSNGAGTATSNFEIDFSNDFSSETMDQERFEFFSADSDIYYSKLSNPAHLP